MITETDLRKAIESSDYNPNSLRLMSTEVYEALFPPKIKVEKWIIKRKYNKHEEVSIDKILFNQSTTLFNITPKSNLPYNYAIKKLYMLQ